MRTAFFLPILLLNLISFCQRNTRVVEHNLKKQFEKIYYWEAYPKMDDSIDTFDSMAKANIYILNQLVRHGHNNPALFHYPFTSLNEYMDVVNSRDKRFRIYSWDSYTGGTMHIFYGVAQYTGADNKIYTFSLTDTSGGEPGLWYSDIYSFHNKGKHYYFCIGNEKYSSHDLGQEVIVYSVHGKSLVAAPIIRTGSGLTNRIHVDFDLAGLDGKDLSIVFDEKNKELKIPVVDEKGKILNRNIVYKFNGEYFERSLAH